MKILRTQNLFFLNLSICQNVNLTTNNPYKHTQQQSSKRQLSQGVSSYCGSLPVASLSVVTAEEAVPGIAQCAQQCSYGVEVQ